MTKSGYISETLQDRAIIAIEQIGIHIWCVEWRHFQWPWM